MSVVKPWIVESPEPTSQMLCGVPVRRFSASMAFFGMLPLLGSASSRASCSGALYFEWPTTSTSGCSFLCLEGGVGGGGPFVLERAAARFSRLRAPHLLLILV